MSGKYRNKHHDWSRIKQEYMRADDTVSVTEILRRNGFKKGNVNPASLHTAGWPTERAELRKRELEAVKKKIIQNTEHEFDEYLRLLDVTRKQIAMFLRGNMKQLADGSYLLKNDHIGKLSEASLAIERVLKSHRLIVGKTTENLGVANYHTAIVNLIRDTKAGKIIDYGKEPAAESEPDNADNNPA
jgi:hypothetical protein